MMKARNGENTSAHNKNDTKQCNYEFSDCEIAKWSHFLNKISQLY